MKKSQYFSLMRETSDLVYPLLLATIDEIRDVDVELHAILRYIIDKRNNQHLLLKPFLLRLTYELCGGTDWKKTIPVGAAFELLSRNGVKSTVDPCLRMGSSLRLTLA